MVPRRTAAALVAELLLAQGRRADLDRRSARRGRGTRLSGRRRQRVAAAARVARRLGIGEEPRVRGVSRTRSTICGASASFPPMSIRSIRDARPTRWSARACRAFSSAARSSPSATCCRSPSSPRCLPGKAGPGSCAASAATSFPGDSPDGLRLPLDSLPWVRPADFPHVYPPDPNQTFEALAARTGSLHSRARAGRPPHRRRHRAGRWRDGCRRCGCAALRLRALRAPALRAPALRAPRRSPPESTVRTSMCAEERDGVLYVFMPPTRSLEDYLELVARGRVERGVACANR